MKCMSLCTFKFLVCEVDHDREKLFATTLLGTYRKTTARLLMLRLSTLKSDDCKSPRSIVAAADSADTTCISAI
jgi:hypothetical protein